MDKLFVQAPEPPAEETPTDAGGEGSGEAADDADIQAAQAALADDPNQAPMPPEGMPAPQPVAPVAPVAPAAPLIPNQPAPQFRNPAIQQALARAEALIQ